MHCGASARHVPSKDSSAEPEHYYKNSSQQFKARQKQSAFYVKLTFLSRLMYQQPKHGALLVSSETTVLNAAVESSRLLVLRLIR